MMHGFTQFLTDFHFLRPWLLLLWLLPLALQFAVFKNKTFVSSWEKVCDAKLLQFLRIKADNNAYSVSKFLILAGLFFSVLAAAGPSWQKQEQTVLTQTKPLMILLNLSSDMQQTDATPNRLVRAKIEMADLLKNLPDVESGLVVYTAEPFLISPLSADPQLIVNLLPAIDFDIMPLNGDRLDRAISLAAEKIKAAGYTSGNLVVFSAAAGMNFDLAVAAAKKAAASGIKVNTVNMAAGDSPKLQQIAHAGQGAAVEGSRGMARLLNDLRMDRGKDWQNSDNQMQIWQDFGYYFLIVPLLCCLYFFRKGLLVLLFVVCLSSTASAGFFLNDNQEAMRLYNQGKYQQAAEKFKDRPWRGSSLYKNGDYAQAAEFFSGNDDVEMLYNYGNALAKNGQLEEAVKAYEEVLQKNAEHEDAKFNLEYIKQQQQQQQQQNQNDNQENQQDSQQSQSEQQNNEQQQPDSNQNQSQQSADSQQDDTPPQQQDNSSSPSGAQPDENENQPQQNSENPENSQQQQAQSAEEQKSRAGQLKEGSDDEEYDELAQAREQKFREIPEDKGGLLKAFIFKEYQKNRYGD